MTWPNLYLELDVLTNDDRNWFWDFDDLFFSNFDVLALGAVFFSWFVITLRSTSILEWLDTW